MIGPFAVTYVFSLQSYGFTETHWREGPPQETLLQFFDIAQELGRRRAVMNGKETVLQAVRISDADLGGRRGTSQVQPWPGDQMQGSAAPSVALNVLLGTNNNEFTKTTQFRGFWDSVEAGGGGIVRTPAFTAAFNSWLQYFVANGFGWRGIVSTQDFPIVGYTESDAGVIRLRLIGNIAGALPLNRSKSVRITGLNGGSSSLNGQQVVINTGIIPAPGEAEVVLKFPKGVIPFQSVGFLKVPSFTTRVATSGEIQRVGKRQAGRPLLVSRGRGPRRRHT